MGAGIAVLLMSTVSLVTGFAFTPTGTAATTVAFADEEEDGSFFDNFLGGIVDTFNPCMNPEIEELPGIREYSGDTTNLGSGSQAYTAYEWYGNAAASDWENYTWEEVGGGCALTLNGFNVVPNMMLSQQNAITSGLVIPAISWVSGINLIDVFFLQPGSVVQNMIQELNRVFYSEYLLIIIVLSAVSLIWFGVVKRQFRNTITDMVWIVIATAAGIFFLSNPTLIAGWMDKGVYAVQTTIISTATQAGTFQAGDRCKVNSSPADYPVSPQVRTMQCSLWDSFVFQPWAEGQMGRAATDGLTTDAESTFRGANEASMVLLDVRTYNREEVASGATRGGAKSSIDERKEEQWAALGETIQDSEISHPYWSGNAQMERITIATGGIISKLFAFIPVLWLTLGMLGQQLIFVMLMLVAPFFLLAGIFPAARRLALGWVEMVLATAVKRVVYAALIGLLFLWFAAVAATSVPSGLFGSIIGVSLDAILMAAGAVVIMVIQRKAIKRAGDLVNLGGQRVTDGGKTREFLTMTGGAVAAGFGSKASGGSFSSGFKENFDNPAARNPAVRSFDAARRTQVARQQKEAQGRQLAIIEDKKAQLASLNKARKREAEENMWMKNGDLSTSEWKEYSQTNNGRAVPRPKNASLAAEFESAGIPLRSTANPKLSAEIDALETEIAELSRRGSSTRDVRTADLTGDGGQSTKTGSVPNARRNVRQGNRTDIDVEFDAAADETSTARPSESTGRTARSRSENLSRSAEASMSTPETQDGPSRPTVGQEGSASESDADFAFTKFDGFFSEDSEAASPPPSNPGSPRPARPPRRTS